MKRILLLCAFIVFTSLSFSLEKAKPQKGEGIYAFLRRHNRTEAKHYEEFVRLNKKKLGRSKTLITGNDYLLPPRKTTVQKPQKENIAEKHKTGTLTLFGEQYKDYDIIDNALAGAYFFLVSGHGGPDPGAIAVVDGHELHEDEYAYDIVLRLARNLLQHRATVHVIIQDRKDGIRDDKYLNNNSNNNETCHGKEIPLSQIARLKQQTNEINRLNFKAKGKYRRAIFVHLDSRSYKKQLDVFFYYQNGKPNKSKSLRLAETMQRTFRSNYDKYQPDRGFSGTVSTRPLYVMRNTTPVSIFVELANMQNVSDQKRYILYDNRQALANWLCEGFIKDYQSSSR